MNLLAIETSSTILSVAIKKGKNKTRAAMLKGFSRHAENLLPLIDKLLKKEKLKVGDIDAFLIGRGPGSFTGLRVGFATLKGLIAVRKTPYYGAFSLDMIAGRIKSKGKIANLHVFLDAKRDKLYVRSYRYHKDRWKPMDAIRVRSLKEAAGSLEKGAWIAGDGILTDKENILSGSEKKPLVLPQKLWHPKASTLIEWFEKKNPMLKPLTKPKELLPVYFRSSEAEERLKDKKQ